MHHQSQGSRMEGQQVESRAAGHRNHRMVWSRMALCSGATLVGRPALLGRTQPACVLGSPGSGEMQQFSLSLTALLYLNSKQMAHFLKLSLVLLADTH